MPYIKQKKRKELNPLINRLESKIETSGDLNYTITRMLHLRTKRLGLKYDQINDLCGTMICALLEFYIQMNIYEKLKIQENGDIGILDDILKIIQSKLKEDCHVKRKL